MATYPTSPRASFMEWCRVHGTAFAAHAAEIGVSEVEAAAFVAETEAARAALLEQAAAQEAAKVATQRAVDAVAKLEKAAGRMVAKVRAFAGTAEAPAAVYAAAQIAPPATPSPQAPPAQPTRLAVTLDASVGALALTWKARNPVGTSGTAYIIRRRLPGEDVFTFVGISGVKTFVDETLPAGVESVQYTVQGQRANSTGPVSAILTVNFGKPSEASASVVVSAPAANIVARSANTNVTAGSMKQNRDPRFKNLGHPSPRSLNVGEGIVHVGSIPTGAAMRDVGMPSTRGNVRHPTPSG